MARQRSVFDVVGPVMIGPSSSHTAGACRLGALALAVFASTPIRAHVLLHGSFAETGLGHGTDLALVAGLLGMRPDDTRIPQAFELADAAGLSVSFAHVDLGDAHPNTAVIELQDAEGPVMTVQGCSVGGGDVLVTRIDAFDVEVTGDLPVLLVAHLDRPGIIAAATGLLAESGVNIASMQGSREARGADALMLIATDLAVGRATADGIAELPGVTHVRRMPSV